MKSGMRLMFEYIPWTMLIYDTKNIYVLSHTNPENVSTYSLNFLIYRR